VLIVFILLLSQARRRRCPRLCKAADAIPNDTPD
jgi:hypothetical protein